MTPPTPRSPNSSAIFEATLKTDEKLRRVVLLSGLCLAIFGSSLTLLLPLPMWLKLALLLAWLVDNARDLRRQQRGFARVRQLRIFADGEILADGPGARGDALTLRTGSLVLRHFAWLRLSFPDGLCYGEPFVDRAGRQPGWQRFRLIWQQSRQAFDRRQESAR